MKNDISRIEELASHHRFPTIDDQNISKLNKIDQDSFHAMRTASYSSYNSYTCICQLRPGAQVAASQVSACQMSRKALMRPGVGEGNGPYGPGC